MIFPPGDDLTYNSQGVGPATQAGAFAQRSAGISSSATNRPAQPVLIKRDYDTTENGVILEPTLTTFITASSEPTFEHVVFPDLNGVAEFEVPYYSQTPISLVGEGIISSTKGTLLTRSRIKVRKSTNPRGLDQPAYSAFNSGGYLTSTATDAAIRPCFGAFSLYEAAADDFSFGYLVGAPYIKRL